MLIIMTELPFRKLLNLTNKFYYEKIIIRLNSLESKPQKGSIDVFTIRLWYYECTT